MKWEVGSGKGTGDETSECLPFIHLGGPGNCRVIKVRRTMLDPVWDQGVRMPMAPVAVGTAPGRVHNDMPGTQANSQSTRKRSPRYTLNVEWGCLSVSFGRRRVCLTRVQPIASLPVGRVARLIWCLP